MQISKITRSYSRSVNTGHYGVAESWIRIESTYEATVESSDNPFQVSEMLYEQARKEVVQGVKDLTDKLKEKNGAISHVAATGLAPIQTPPATETPNTLSNPTIPSGSNGGPRPL